MVREVLTRLDDRGISGRDVLSESALRAARLITDEEAFEPLISQDLFGAYGDITGTVPDFLRRSGSQLLGGVTGAFSGIFQPGNLFNVLTGGGGGGTDVGSGLGGATVAETATIYVQGNANIVSQATPNPPTSPETRRRNREAEDIAQDLGTTAERVNQIQGTNQVEQAAVPRRRGMP